MEGRPSNTNSTLSWFIQAGLGIMLVILLGVHLIANHWIAPQGLLGYEDVIRYFNVPGIAPMELSFLIVVTAYCLLGIYSILLDLNLSSRIKTFCKWLLIVIGVTTVLYGVRLTWLITAL
jgi:succinate dehydrogenase hydrophobic anchor subunit